MIRASGYTDKDLLAELQRPNDNNWGQEVICEALYRILKRVL